MPPRSGILGPASHFRGQGSGVPFDPRNSYNKTEGIELAQFLFDSVSPFFTLLHNMGVQDLPIDAQDMFSRMQKDTNFALTIALIVGIKGDIRGIISNMPVNARF